MARSWPLSRFCHNKKGRSRYASGGFGLDTLSVGVGSGRAAGRGPRESTKRYARSDRTHAAPRAPSCPGRGVCDRDRRRDACGPSAGASPATSGTVIVMRGGVFGPMLMVGSGKYTGYSLYMITSDDPPAFGCTTKLQNILGHPGSCAGKRQTRRPSGLRSRRPLHPSLVPACSRSPLVRSSARESANR